MKNILIHQIPDFAQELEVVFESWNKAQEKLHFASFRPPKAIEVDLLTKGEMHTDKGLNLVYKARQEKDVMEDDIVILFTEKRLYEEDYFQLYFVGSGSNSIISIDFTKKFFCRNRNVVFKAVLINILTTISHKYGLDSHRKTRICVMDFLNRMPDILKNIEKGPKYCDQCKKGLHQENLYFLLSLADATKNLEHIDTLSESVSKKLYLEKTRLQDDQDEFDYDIVLSYAREDKDIVDQLAILLKKKNVKIFYDGFEKAKMWGKDLYVYLSDMYRLRAHYCIMFLSQNYASKLWTNHERKAAQARALKENQEYILPIRIDDTDIPGILPTICYLDFRKEDIEEIAECVIQKLKDSPTPTTNIATKFTSEIEKIPTDIKKERGGMIAVLKPWYKKRLTKIISVIGGLVLITTLLINLKTIKEWFYPPRIKTSTPKGRQLPSTNEKKLSVSLKKICKDIDSRPLAQQSDTANQYVGIRIQEERLKLLEIDKNPEGDIYFLSMVFPDQSDTSYSSRRILCDIPKEQYPELNFAKEVELYVSGRIKEAGVKYIELSEVSLKFE